MDHEKWTRFGVVARANNRSKAAELRVLIDRSLEQFELEQAA